MNANKSALFALSAALVNRPDSFPQIVERNGIVEGDGADDLAVAHLQVPRIRVLVRLAVASNCGSIPQHNDRVAISVDGPHCRYERRRQPGELESTSRRKPVNQKRFRRGAASYRKQFARRGGFSLERQLVPLPWFSS